MKRKEIKSEFIEYDSLAELSAEEQSVIRQAQDAMKNAYAPYSQFKVGAAVMLENGKIILGSNQENSAYPLGLCAERVALFAAAAQYPERKAMCIAIITASENPAAPCGACRQVMAEFETRFNAPISILLMSSRTGKIISAEGIKNFLPLMFTRKDLGK